MKLKHALFIDWSFFIDQIPLTNKLSVVVVVHSDLIFILFVSFCTFVLNTGDDDDADDEGTALFVL